MAGLAEESDGAPQDIDHAINLFLGVVKVEAGAGGAGELKPFHQGLRAMMTTAHRQTLAIGKLHQVMGMRAVETEGDQRPSRPGGWTEDSQSRQVLQPLQSILS